MKIRDDQPPPPPPGDLVPLRDQPGHHGHRGEGGARGLGEHQRPAPVVTSALRDVQIILAILKNRKTYIDRIGFCPREEREEILDCCPHDGVVCVLDSEGVRESLENAIEVNSARVMKLSLRMLLSFFPEYRKLRLQAVDCS